jgi:hypothetical protein
MILWPFGLSPDLATKRSSPNADFGPLILRKRTQSFAPPSVGTTSDVFLVSPEFESPTATVIPWPTAGWPQDWSTRYFGG